MNGDGRRSSVQRVLGHLLNQASPVTRPQVAAACDVSRPTAFAAMEKLEQAGLVANVGQELGRPGRSATLYQVPTSAGVLAGIDLGGSNVRTAITDLRGQLLAENKAATSGSGGADIVRQAVRQVGDALRAAGVGEEALAGVGVSVPGVVGPDQSTVCYASNIDQFDPFDIRSPLQSALRAPVSMDNNVNCAAMGERWQGAARTLDTFAVVSIGAGIGCGIVHDGVLVRGAHGAAGEVAFLPPEGELRKLDAKAHDAAGGLALLQDAQTRAGWSGRPPGNVEEIFDRAAAGEPTAAALVEEECQRIAVVIASVCAVVDPQAVVLTGGVGGNRSLIERAAGLAAAMTIFPPEVIPSSLEDRASLVGAIHLATVEAHRLLVARAAVN